MSRTLQVACWYAAIALLCVLSAQRATADSQFHRDARNDVVREFGADPQGGMAGIDVRGVRNTYVGDRLRVSMTTVHLREDGWGAYWSIKPAGSETVYSLFYENSFRRPYVVFFSSDDRISGSRAVGQRPPKTCKGAKAHVRGSTVTASVPSRCIADADIVRVSGVMQDNERNYLLDDSRTRGSSPSTQPFHFGPPLRRS